MRSQINTQNTWSQMTTVILFNCILGFGVFSCLFGVFKCPFFNLSHFKNILFLSQCGIGSFDSQSNTVHFSLNENIPLLEEYTWGISLHEHPVLLFFPRHLLIGTVRSRWILPDGCWVAFLYFLEKSCAVHFCYKVGM